MHKRATSEGQPGTGHPMETFSIVERASDSARISLSLSLSLSVSLFLSFYQLCRFRYSSRPRGLARANWRFWCPFHPSLEGTYFAFSPASGCLFPGYFHNDTLSNVNYCRRNELEEVLQDADLLCHPRSSTPPLPSSSSSFAASASSISFSPFGSLVRRVSKVSPSLFLVARGNPTGYLADLRHRVFPRS